MLHLHRRAACAVASACLAVLPATLFAADPTEKTPAEDP